MARAVGLLGIALGGALFALRPSDPALADPAQQEQRVAAARRAARAAAGALRALEVAVEAARHAARAAAGRVLVGEEDPGRIFEAAAERWLDAAVAGGLASDLLESARSSEACPASGALRAVDVVGFSVIAAQLREARGGAETIFTLRRASEETLRALEATLAALEAGDLTSATESHALAQEQLAAARASYAGLEGVMPTAATWFETTARLVDAAGGLARARLAGDAAAADAAARSYREAAGGASLADRALGLALAEGAADVSEPALAASGRAANEVRAAAAAVREFAEGDRCR